MKYGFGLVGCGTIAPVFAAAIEQLDNARLVAVSDAVEDRARALAERFGADWHASYDELLARNDVQVVSVLTWSGMHAEMGVAAAQAGKHVLTTKPIDVTLEKIDRLVETCRSRGVKLAAVHQVRSSSSFVRLKRAIDDGALGRIHFGNAYIPWCRTQDYYDSAQWRGTWRWDGGGCLMNQGIHTVDVLQWLVGPVAEVQAYTDTLAHEIEVEDAAAAALRFANGALGVIMGSTAVCKGLPSRIEVFGANGNVVIEGEDVIRWQVGDEETFAPFTGAAAGATDPKAGLMNAIPGHVEQIGDFVRAIEENREPMLNGEEARKAVALILAIYESARTGKAARPG
ncbi:MAG: Gfo/Idh/MocA family oxidoreductase [Armatimonadota bacterium]|nr:MAG: Gfo/Idh/MocA family oxidoreductase [Armatimonadota bacterium]